MLRDRQIHLSYEFQLGKEWIPQNISSQFFPQKNLEILAQKIRQTPDRRPDSTKFNNSLIFVISPDDI